MLKWEQERESLFVGWNPKETKKHMRLVLPAEQGGEMRSDRRVWCCLWCVYSGQVGTKCAAYEFGCGNVRMDVRRRGEEVSKDVPLLFTTEEGGKGRGD